MDKKTSHLWIEQIENKIIQLQDHLSDEKLADITADLESEKIRLDRCDRESELEDINFSLDILNSEVLKLVKG